MNESAMAAAHHELGKVPCGEFRIGISRADRQPLADLLFGLQSDLGEILGENDD
jgi:hypothetical protein